jgi:integrase
MFPLYGNDGPRSSIGKEFRSNSKVGWHTFRHTYHASLKRCGTSLEVQKELMRHANVRTTAEIYGLDPDLTPAHREANSGVVKMLLGV